MVAKISPIYCVFHGIVNFNVINWFLGLQITLKGGGKNKNLEIEKQLPYICCVMKNTNLKNAWWWFTTNVVNS